MSILKKERFKNTLLNNTNRNTTNCVFQQEPVLSILKKERFKNTLLNPYVLMAKTSPLDKIQYSTYFLMA